MPLPIKKAYNDNLLTRIISAEDIRANFGGYQRAISFYRAYPDKLVDLLIEASGPDCNFKLYPFQRLMLRSFARSQKTFLTFSRGTSKSFVVVLWMFLCCILYPGYKFGQVANSKQQSAAILEAKVSEVLSLLPILEFEVKRKSKVKDQLIVTFKNGSFFQNVAQKQTSRGLRFTGIVVEEICEMADDQMLREVILPTLAIKRRCANGYYDPNDTMSQMEIYVTTAGLILQAQLYNQNLTNCWNTVKLISPHLISSQKLKKVTKVEKRNKMAYGKDLSANNWRSAA